MPAFVSPDNIQVTPLQSVAFAPGASVSVQTAGALPTGRRVRHVFFVLDIDATQPAAPVAQFGFAYHQLLAQIKIARRISITGLGLHFLNWLERGQEPSTPPGFAAGVVTNVASRRVVWQLNYADISSQKPDDGCVPSELWTDPIEVRFGTNATFAAPAPVLGNGLLRVYVVHDAASVAKNGKRVTIPQSINIQSDDFNALTALINKPGAWAYALVYREIQPADGGIITSANVSNVIVSVDGIPLMNNVRGQDIASIFNGIRAHGTNYESEGQTLPVPGATNAALGASQPGEAINDQPAVGFGAGQGVTLNFLPLLFPSDNWKMSQVPRAKIGMRVDMTGTLGAYKIAYRIIERRPDQGIGNAARRLGVSAGVYSAKTAPSAIGDDPELAPFLPATVSE
jgi:hypothetical protein